MVSTSTHTSLPAVWPRDTGSLIDLVGRTPLYRVRSLAPTGPGVELWAKLERFNPGGSIKDRPAAMMLLDGLARGSLRPGRTILESTSGNTGVALAMLGRALGYPVKICMSAAVSTERKQTLRAFGTDLVLTDPGQGSDGAIAKAQEIYEADPDAYFTPEQYNNPAGIMAHVLTTAPEIWDQTGGRVTHLVAPIGTSGTVMGTGRGLRQRNPRIQIIAVEPDAADHGLIGMRHIPSTIRPGIYDPAGFDRLIRVSTQSAYEMARRLALSEGLFLGATSAATLIAAHQVALELTDGVVVSICPDGGSRYLSAPIFRPSVEAPT